MIPRFFLIVQRSKKMSLEKDPCPYRVVSCLPAMELAEEDYLGVIGNLDTEAVAYYEWDLFHGLSFRCASKNMLDATPISVPYSHFDNPQLRALVSQKLSERIVTWCIESLERKPSPAKEVPK